MLPPRPQRNWALFLDLDGTLLDIAARPEAVVVPDNLAQDILAAKAWLGGALAIVSGRSMASLVQVFGPVDLNLVAEHGAVQRYHGIESGIARPLPPASRARIREAARAWPGTLVEEKASCVAVHYRQAPHCAKAIEALLEEIARTDRRFQLLSSRMAFELRDAEVNKGTAVKMLMRTPPYAGRIPVFVGDDITDEDGFREAVAQGGLALHVNGTFDGNPANVRAWLKNFR